METYRKKPFDKGFHDGFYGTVNGNPYTGDEAEAYSRGTEQGKHDREANGSVPPKATQA